MPSGHGGLWAWPEEVERKLSLREQEVPTVSRKSWGCAGQDGQEMIFERAYGSLGAVAAVYMRWY